MIGLGPLRVERSRFKRIMSLALPIIGGMASQNALNLVDTFMVSFYGANAVAAVGLGGAMNFLATAFFMGMANGVQAMVARRQGEGRHTETAIPLNGALLTVVCLGLPLTALLIFLAPGLVRLFNSDPEVIALCVPFFQVRLVGMIALGANFSFRGFWNGINVSALYLRTLLLMHTTNALVSYVLIFGELGFPELGSTGAGIGTTVSIYVGTLYYFYLGRQYAKDAGFLRALPSWETIRTMLRLSIPSGMQQLFFAAGMSALYVIMGMVGTAELAATNVLTNIMLVALLPSMGLGLAAASLVGQALGRRDLADAYAWGWDVVRVAVMIVSVIAIPMWLIPEWLLYTFFRDEPQALAIAVWPLRLVGFTMPLDTIGVVLLSAVIGAGATRMALLVSITAQWVVFLPVAYIVGPVLGFGLFGIWLAQVSYRCGQSGVFAWLWQSRRWNDVAM